MAMYVEPLRRGGGRHRPQVVLAVRFGRVHVHIALDVDPVDEPRQRVRFCSVELTAKLAQLRRHPLEAERSVDIVLVAAGNRDVLADAKQPVFVQQETEPHGAVAQARCCEPSIR